MEEDEEVWMRGKMLMKRRKMGEWTKSSADGDHVPPSVTLSA